MSDVALKKQLSDSSHINSQMSSQISTRTIRNDSSRGFGTQIKPTEGWQEMRSYDLTVKNRRASEAKLLQNDKVMKIFLQAKESEARSTAESRTFYIFCQDAAAAILVILRHLITIESAISCLLSTAATLTLYCFHADWDARYGTGYAAENGGVAKPTSYGKSMSFLILSFFLIMPITTFLRITFMRRERALQHICKMKACAMATYQCHATWSWKYKEGEEKLDRLQHSDECLHLLTDLADTMTRFLTLPMTGYPRHREIARGRGEEETTIAAAYSLFETSVSVYGTKLGLLTERMKDHGFSPSEASRVRQSERMLLEASEYLRYVG